jgi:hypothetical protein
MTHALHRQGTRENLKDDFTMLMLPAVGINDKGSGPNRWRLLDMVLRHNGVFAGQANIGNLAMYSRQELLDRVKKGFELQDAGGMSPCMCCGSKQDVVNILKEVVEADMGLSIIVQGSLDDVKDCLQQAGLKPHTVHHSLGVWGRTEKLPEREILEITTMCGHGLVGSNLVKKCTADITSGKKTTAEAAQVLSRPCICGIFNTKRAEMLLGRIAAKRETEQK